MLRAIEYRICPTEEPKVLLAGTSGCCRFAYKRALHMKITACKGKEAPPLSAALPCGACKRCNHDSQGNVQGREVRPQAVRHRQARRTDGCSIMGGWKLRRTIPPRWISSLPEKCIHPGRNKYRAVDCIHAWQEKTRTCETKKHWCYPYMETFYLNKID